MENKKILIVDDDSDYTTFIKTILENERFSTCTANSREEGMEKIKTEKPELIILDVMLSTWSDGFEMSREIKKDPQYKNIRILILSSVESKTGIEFKSSAGDPDWLPVDGFLDKATDPQALLDEVKKLLSVKI